MSLFAIRPLPRFFGRISTKVALKDMTLLPFCMIFALVINVCMSLSNLEFMALSYAVQAVVLASFLFMTYLMIHEGGMSRYGFLFFLFMFLMVCFTILNATDIKNGLYTTIAVWLMMLILRYWRHRMGMLLQCFAIALSFCAYVNFLHVLTNPLMWLVDENKSPTGYLLGGNYNQMGCRLIIAIITSILCLRYHRLWMVNVIGVSVAVVATLAMVGSMTSLSMIAVFLLYCVVPSRRLRRWGIYGLFAGFLIFQIFVVFSEHGLENNEMAVYIVEDVLKKDITFTNRTHMWDSALRIIVKSPLYGYGYVDGDWFKSYMTSWATGPHNFVLYVLVTGGIVLMALYVMICLMAYKAIHPFRDERLAQTTLFCVVTLMFMALMEAYPFPVMFYAISLLYYYPYISCRKIPTGQ